MRNEWLISYIETKEYKDIQCSGYLGRYKPKQIVFYQKNPESVTLALNKVGTTGCVRPYTATQSTSQCSDNFCITGFAWTYRAALRHSGPWGIKIPNTNRKIVTFLRVT